VTADEEARQNAVNDFVVPDNHPADLIFHRLIALAEFLRLLLHGLTDAHEVPAEDVARSLRASASANLY
jgi:hypothetical protein